MGKFTGPMIASDLDGTIYNEDGKISKKTMEALAYYKENGGVFTVSTGRVYQSFSGFHHTIPFNAPVLLGNGTMIYDYHSDKILFQCDLPPRTEEAVVETRSLFPDIGIEIYRFRETYIYNMNKITKNHAKNLRFEYSIINDIACAAKPWQKVLYTGEEPRLRLLREHLENKYTEACFMFSIPVFLEMINKKTNKGEAVLRLAKMLKIPESGIYSVGDNQNDIDMLRAAAISFAPANGNPEAVKQADVVLPPNNEHTLAALIEYIDTQGNV